MVHDTVLQDAELVLRPLREQDVFPLVRLASTCQDEFALMGTSPTSSGFYERALEAKDQRPFVIEVDGELAGSTRYGDIRERDRGLEIGWTWLHPQHHGIGVNRRMKLLLFAHAFDTLGSLRVQLKTDARNLRSQRAIEKLGAVKEGVLRSHMLLPDGHVRDTVMYSVISTEWPEVRARLERQD